MTEVSAPPPSAYMADVAIGFKHCDPAGMVFYPRYVEMLNDAVERWFGDGLGCDFHALHLQRRIAIPTVSLNCQFMRPSRLGDRLVSRLHVERIGRSSVTLGHRLSGHDDPADVRLTAQQVIVFVQMDSMAKIDVPPDILATLRGFLIPPGVQHA